MLRAYYVLMAQGTISYINKLNPSNKLWCMEYNTSSGVLVQICWYLSMGYILKAHRKVNISPLKQTSKCYISKMFHTPYFVYNMPCFIKSKELLTIKGTPIYLTSTKGEKLPIIMVYYILISEMLKCEKKVS